MKKPTTKKAEAGNIRAFRARIRDERQERECKTVWLRVFGAAINASYTEKRATTLADNAILAYQRRFH